MGKRKSESANASNCVLSSAFGPQCAAACITDSWAIIGLRCMSGQGKKTSPQMETKKSIKKILGRDPESHRNLQVHRNHCEAELRDPGVLL